MPEYMLKETESRLGLRAYVGSAHYTSSLSLHLCDVCDVKLNSKARHTVCYGQFTDTGVWL
jgi:hypothetical protein